MLLSYQPLFEWNLNSFVMLFGLYVRYDGRPNLILSKDLKVLAHFLGHYR